MRRSTVTTWTQWAGQLRMYRTPLGGAYFEQPLPSSLGASRSKGKATSTAHISTKGRGKRGKKQLLSVPLTAEGLKSQLRQLGGETAVYNRRRRDDGEVCLAEDSHRDMRWRALYSTDSTGNTPMRASNESSPVIVAKQGSLVLLDTEEEEVGNNVVLPGSSVLASDLDRLERDMMRDYHQRGKELPHFDNVYVAFGGGRSSEKSYHVLAEEYRHHMAKAKGVVGTGMSGLGVNLCRGFQQKKEDENETEEDAMLPPEANPHFPVAMEAGTASAVTATTATQFIEHAVASSSPLSSAPSSFPYDAYIARPVRNRLLQLRGAEFWNDAENRERLQQRMDYAIEGHTHEMLTEGSVDTSEIGYSTNRVRRETLLYFQAHPINEMIQVPFVRIRSILLSDGEAEVYFPAGDADTDVDLPASQARRMARELGLDLVQVGTIHTDKNDRRVIAICTIADHREHMRDMIRFKVQKLGVQPPPTKECIEVPFRGGTHPHAIRFKSIGIAKHLLHRHVVRINLTKFGTPKEGFPVFRTILDEVKKQTLQLKAYHTASMVRANYNEVYCYLFPSTGRSPKTTVTHPTQEQLDATRDQRILEDEREIYFDDLNNKKTARERLAYIQKLEKGTAWADKDEGLSLQRQRDIKIMLGYLPKGNHELYGARGDVNIPSPFRASHPTSVEQWTHPPETNLEQASRGAAVLGKRLAMTVSEMHDRQESADNPTTLDRFYYRLQGPALEAGEFKEALGLKRNRKSVPRYAPGWGTLGMPKNPPEEPGYAAK
ncbi:hypothetical protein TraAM80_02340 [Trypanosoma rangeli]|uniref:Uncharacterized protein n=1 Tax=Trypanosoma rangeli TaxID=5698 RepID=A0A3S5IRX2_TRYRA|nr:uncharacterized protein TraAM80_02340 [Trypanosoma rangeli]RNF09195.1 hypothetical protein TraAM80_02340 [Trypanosoma rangeli]|eukprot:RNF09195.1 hypothetical protein TraAM80_02340 [Trypanosoma rangeli]